MSQQGETDRRQEDEWWRQLYGQSDPGGREAGDTLDDRYSSALSALGEEADDGGAVSRQAGRQDTAPAAPGDTRQAGTGPPAAPGGDAAGGGDTSADDSGPPDTLRLRRPAPPPATAPRPWQYQGPPQTPAAPEPASPPPGLPPGWAPADPAPDPARSAAPSATAAPAPPAGLPEPTLAEAPYVGDGPPTYDPEPTAWPAADPDDLDGLVPDSELDGAHYGLLTVRTASVRGDSARYRGEPRRDAVLTARFGSGDDALLFIAVASGPRTSDTAHRAARDACTWIAAAVGRSQARLSEDIRASRRGSLKSGLHRLTDRAYGRLRARGEDLGLDPAEYSATLRCLLLPAGPDCRIRLFFGVGDGGLYRIRGGEWQDLDPWRPDERAETEDSPAIHFRFRASVARSGDTLLLCSGGLAAPLRGEPALVARLTQRWGAAEPPGLPAFLGDTQTRVKGYADDRTAVAVWDA
ncbi:protein phosphatase 2C domain-containing protein [Actinacidiphila sp. bgisy160]|uniref:protein phosphatase 2C domain-containing protein n=1 Tax=Actinacidiphila sp. bgisy160 TaxID=3413796 RepID=UPI003D74E3BC